MWKRTTMASTGSYGLTRTDTWACDSMSRLAHQSGCSCCQVLKITSQFPTHWSTKVRRFLLAAMPADGEQGVNRRDRATSPVIGASFGDREVAAAGCFRESDHHILHLRHSRSSTDGTGGSGTKKQSSPKDTERENKAGLVHNRACYFCSLHSCLGVT